MSRFYSKDIFIYNIETLVKYGWEPEIEVLLQNKKVLIIAYEEFVDYIEENGVHIQAGKIMDVLQFIEWEKIETIRCMGLDFSMNIDLQSIVKDGKLWLTAP